MRKNFIIAVFLSFIFSFLYGKECDSELNAHLIPFSEKTSGNTEFVLSGYLFREQEKWDWNGKIFFNFALEHYFSDSWYFFMNSALKYKTESTKETDSQNKGKGLGNYPIRLGVRDFFLGYQDSTFEAKIGFLTYTLNDSLLLDERALGLDMRWKESFFIQPRFIVGWVISRLAREGRSCASQFAFDKKEDLVKDKEFANSFGAIVFNWNFITSNKRETKREEKEEEEFEEINNNDKNTIPFRFQTNYYFETYDNYEEWKQFIGLYHSYGLGDFRYSLEIATQFYQKGIALGYLARFSYLFFFSSFSLQTSAGFTSYLSLQNNSIFSPIFSNLFLSDYMQYLTKDKDILFLEIQFKPSQFFYLSSAFYYDLSGIKTWEIDNAITYYYKENSQIRFSYQQIQKENLYHQFLLEIRHIF